MKHIYFFLMFAVSISCAACNMDRQRNPQVEMTVPALDNGTPSPAPVVKEGIQTASASASTPSPLRPHSPLGSGLNRYIGPSIYGPEFPSFEIHYDPARWTLIENESPSDEPRLVAQHIPNCQMRLQAGAIEAYTVSTVQLAEREWIIRQAQPDALMYDIPYEGGAYILGVRLPQPYSETEKSPCQTAAEQVIDSFKLVTD